MATARDECPLASRFDGQLAVVTGAAGGIGWATAQRLVREGARVVAMDSDDAIKVRAPQLDGGTGRAIGMAVDCTDRRAVEDAFRAMGQEFPAIDVLVNCVGQSARERMTEFWCSDPATWDFVIAVNLKSTMLCTRQVVPNMRERRRGRVVNIASVSWLVPTPNFADYSAAKAGVVGFTRTLAMELAPFAVTVNAISPGPIRTRALDNQPPGVQERIKASVPLGVYGEPEDIAAGVAYLASDEARFVTGHNLVISGGRGMV